MVLMAFFSKSVGRLLREILLISVKISIMGMSLFRASMDLSSLLFPRTILLNLSVIFGPSL
jgi:hypothetical protein